MRTFSLQDYGPLAPVHVGGLSQAFAAHQRSTGQEVRVRQLLPQFRERPEAVSRWLRWAERSAAIDHPGCVRVLDYGVFAGEAYAVCERVSAVDLRSVLASLSERGERPSVSACVALALDLLDVLAGVQERSMYAHLDIEPRSTLLRPDGSLLLTEFGMWEAVETAEAARRRFDLGRVHYLAPELARSQTGDVRSDVFSVGAMLYELLTGERPFQAKTQLLVAIAIAEGKRRSLRDLGLDLPEELVDIVETMMALDPNERFQSPRAARNALAALEEGYASSRVSWAELVSRLHAQGDATAEATVSAPVNVDRVQRTVDFDFVAYRARMARAGALSAPGASAEVPSVSTSESLQPPPLLGPGLELAVAPWRASEPGASGALGASLPSPCGSGGEALAPPPLFDAPLLEPSSPAQFAPTHAEPRPPGRDGRAALFKRRTGSELPVMAPEPQVQISSIAQLDAWSRHDEPWVVEPARARAEQGWRDPSHTLFQPKRYAKHELRDTRTKGPLWARAMLAVLFGFVAVAGAVLLYRLWS